MNNKRMWNLLKEMVEDDIETFTEYAKMHTENGEFMKADKYSQKASDMENILQKMIEIERM